MEYEGNASKSKDKTKNIIREILEWTATIIFALVAAMLIKSFIFVPIEVRMVSMQDTLFEGQRLIVYKLGYRFELPEKGDIIIFEHQEGRFEGLLKYLPVPNPGEVDFIKRVIALPGDEIDIKEGQVFVNGKLLDEPYVKGSTDSRNMSLPVKVPANKLFVMGDNREHSSDSRELGFIDLNKVRGKAVLRIWPLKYFGGI